jgi:hypothetical protein
MEAARIEATPSAPSARNPYAPRARYHVATLDTACRWSPRTPVPANADAYHFARNLFAQPDVVRVHLWDNGELVQRFTPAGDAK